MLFDPARRVRETLWVTGCQWAGKSTVSGIVARRHGTLVYRYDYHRNRSHLDRQRVLLQAAGETLPDPEETWLGHSPSAMAQKALEVFRLRFEWVLDDLSALDGDIPVLAEGWGLLPDLVTSVAADPRQVIVLMSTPQWRLHQVEALERASRFSAEHQVSDPARARRNRYERDLLIAEETVRQAELRSIKVLDIDGRRDAAAVADSVAEHFAPFLPPRLHTER